MNRRTLFGIDHRDTVTLDPEVKFRGDSAETYPALSRDQRTHLLEELRRSHEPKYVNAVLGPLWDWKITSYANHAATHEELYKRLFGSSQSVRNHELHCRPPFYEPEFDVAVDLFVVSQQFLREHVGDTLTLYRGIQRRSGDVIAGPLDATGRVTFEMDRTVLMNFTLSETIARKYGHVVLELDVPRTAVFLAPDFVLPHVRFGAMANKDAEVRLLGDRVPRYTLDDLRLSVTNRPVRAAFDRPQQLTTEEHVSLLDVVQCMAETGTTLSSAGITAVENWYDAMAKSLGPADDRVDAAY